MRAALLCLFVLLSTSLGACQIVYKLSTRQGNVLEQKELDQLQVGMSRSQVTFLLGTPIASSSLSPDRWDYLGYYKNPRGKVYSRTVRLYFEGDKLARMEGEKIPVAEAGKPDLEAIEKEEKKAKVEEERAQEPTASGVVIKQPKKE